MAKAPSLPISALALINPLLSAGSGGRPARSHRFSLFQRTLVKPAHVVGSSLLDKDTAEARALGAR